MAQISGNFYRALLIIGMIALICGIILSFNIIPSLTGPLVIIACVTMAIGVMGFKSVRSLSYTLWIFAAVVAAMFYPAWFRSIGSYQLSNLIVPLLQVIMFGMGTTMSLADFAGVVKMPKGVFVGLACQFSIMPIVGTGLAHSFGFPPEIAAGLILVGSCPSGLASNVMAFIAKANVALSITLTACATLLAPLMTPLLMKYLAGQFVPVDFWGMMASIVKIVIIPIVAGLLFHHIVKTPFNWQNKLSRISGSLLGSCIFIIGLVIGLLKPDLVAITGDSVGVILAIDLIWITFFAVGIGIMLEKNTRTTRFVDHVMPLISMIGIAVIIAIITSAGREDLLKVGLLLILACLIHNLAGYTLGFYGCRLIGLDEKSCRTIALEVGLQNGGLATGIAKEMGKLATVGLAPAIFGPLMNITGSSLASWWREKPVADELETTSDDGR